MARRRSSGGDGEIKQWLLSMEWEQCAHCTADGTTGSGVSSRRTGAPGWEGSKNDARSPVDTDEIFCIFTCVFYFDFHKSVFLSKRVSPLVQVMAWRLSGAKSLPEPMIARLIDAYILRYISITDMSSWWPLIGLSAWYIIMQLIWISIPGRSIFHPWEPDDQPVKRFIWEVAKHSGPIRGQQAVYPVMRRVHAFWFGIPWFCPLALFYCMGWENHAIGFDNDL